MKTIQIISKSASIAALLLLMMSSCNSDPLSPGIEYMPDMYRSPAVEEYVDYGEMKDRISDSAAVIISVRLPVPGTIPYTEDASKAHYNFPYPYENTPEDYERAGSELSNPVVYNEAVYLEAKAKYQIMCVHCHGEKGAGQGILVKNGKFAPPPAYQGIAGLTPGKMFHTMHYGKGNMGSHAGQLTREERWKLVHYVQTLHDGEYTNPFKAKKKTVKKETTTESGEE